MGGAGGGVPVGGVPVGTGFNGSFGLAPKSH